MINSLAELGSLGVAFVSFRDNLDLSTPSGRLMFQIIGAMAEFERALIQERVRAGIRNARAKGTRVGRPRVVVDPSRIASLRAQGLSWSQIVTEVGVGIKGQRNVRLLACPKLAREVFDRLVQNVPISSKAYGEIGRRRCPCPDRGLSGQLLFQELRGF